MKFLYSCFLSIVIAAAANAQGTYTWSGNNFGLWTTAGNWSPARSTPNANDTLLFSAGNTRTILNVQTQTVGRIRIFNNTNITLYGQLGGATLTINNNAGDDLIVTSGSLIPDVLIDGVVMAAGATADISGTYRNASLFNISAAGVVATVKGNFDNRSTLTGASTASMIIENGGTFLHGMDGGTVPTITWIGGSTLNLSGMTDNYPAGMNQTFKNVIFSSALDAAITMSGNLSCEDLTISISGDDLRLTNDAADRTITVAGDFTQTEGNFVLVSDDGDGTLNVAGNFRLSGGLFRGKEDNGAARVNVTGNFTQTGGTFDLWAANGNADAINTVTGNFILSGGTFDICGTINEQGRLNVAGNYTHSGGTFTETGGGSSNGLVVFNGTGTQTFISGGPVSNTINYTVNSGATLQMAAASTVVSGGGTFTLGTGAGLGIRAMVGITSAGTNTGNIQTTGRSFNAGAHYIYNGTGNQTTLGTAFPNNLTGSLTIDNASNVTMGTGRTIANGGTVYLTNGAFATASNLTMASNSKIVRSGGTLTGTLQGGGLYNVVFNGASKSTGPELGGTGLSGLTVNLNAGQVLTLNQSRTMAGVLTLTNGILTTTPTQLLTIGTGGNASAGSNNSFVNGPLAKNTNSIAGFTFPVGTLTGSIRRIGINTTTTNATTFTARFFDSNPQVAYSGAGFSGGITRISACEYWTLNRSTGGTPSPATVTLSWSTSTCADPYVGNPITLRVARHNGAAPGTWQDAGYSSSTPSMPPYTSGTVTSAVVNSFSPFAIGTSNGLQNPLPVLFADVKAYAKNDGVQIEWSNLTEREITGYTVERSTDGTSFSGINQQAAGSNNDDKQSYTHFDPSPKIGLNFYRIRVNEMSGRFTYSKILRVDIGNSRQSFALYPNPVIGRVVTVSITGMKNGQYNLKIINTTGQAVFETKIVNRGSATTQTLELPASVKAGVYTIVLTGSEYRESKIVIVQ